MPTTSNFGWTTPADTDLVKDGAAAIRTLGNGIDTSFIDLKGGTTGQVLSKASNTDLDFSWVAQDDSNAIQNALLTTTGDTIYASAASTPARLGIGTTGQVLTVAGGVPTWATPASTASGLTLITRSTFSSVSSHSVNSVFSSTYDNYRVLITLDTDSATEQGHYIRLRTGSDATTNYVNNRVTILGTGVYNGTPTDKFDIGNLASTFDMASVSIDFYKPNLAEKTGMTGLGNFNGNSIATLIYAGGQTDSTQFTGFTIFGAAGNITGVATVYGYQKS